MAPDFNNLRTIAREAAAAGTVPGGVLAVGTEGRTVFVEAFGDRRIEPDRAPATVDTVYDLASLTKALCTSLLSMRAVAAGKLDLDEPVAGRLPSFRGKGKELVTIRHLLSHASGLPAHRPFHAAVLPAGGAAPDPVLRARVVELAAAEPLAYTPGSKSVYSDLGFIVLGQVLEDALGARLDTLFTNLVTTELGLPGLRFRPGGVGPANATRLAPTERCAVRGRLCEGEVHDLNAYAMGGVAGHAGLFGRADDVAALASTLCRAWKTGGDGIGRSPAIDQQTLRRFWRSAGVPGSTWRLGWDGPAAVDSQAGQLISREAVGHLAFTGCALWIDPERDVFVVILTNRVHPAVRDDPAFRRLRPAVVDAALAAIGYQV